MKKQLLALFLCATHFLFAQKPISYQPDKVLLKIIEQNFIDADSQYKVLMKNLPADKCPKNYSSITNRYEFSSSSWWCSGFYPGTLLYLFQQTKDSTLYKEAMRMLTLLEKEKLNTRTHDLGFMMYCSFGNADKIFSKPEYKQILLTSAKSLSTRFNPTVGCIKSWDSKSNDFIVIIDNMMNLEMLFWATRISGDSSFYKIAVAHANTTMLNHFRSDYSSYHVINYNPQTGAVQQKKTAQALPMSQHGLEDKLGVCMAIRLCTEKQKIKIFRASKAYCIFYAE